MLTNRHDSYRSTPLVIRKVDPSHRRSIRRRRQYILKCSIGVFSVTNRHDSHGSTRLIISKVNLSHRSRFAKELVESSLLDNISNPPSQLLVEYFLVLRFNFRYDGSTSIVTSRSIRVGSSRLKKIGNPLSWPLAEYFPSVLQIDFRYDGSTSTVTSRSIRVYSITSPSAQ